MQSEMLTAPCTVDFQNNSEGAEFAEWVIDDTITYSSPTMSHQFLSSGRHLVELKLKKGNKTYSKAKEIIIKAPESCLVLMCTTAGDLLLELSEKTPGHRENFTRLVESGYYSGIIFHRVIEGFMIQGGDNDQRTDKGKYKFEDKIPHEINSELIHHRGALAAARMPDNINPNRASSGTQFYIVHGKSLSESSIKTYEDSRTEDYTEQQKAQYLSIGGAPQLDDAYTVFGKLIGGFETLDKIAGTKTDNRDKPTEEIVILKAININ